MSADFTQFHEELRTVARQLLSRGHDRGGPVVLDRSELAASGWLGLEVPDSLGGAGATFAEAAVVLEELGRASAGSAFVGSAVLGAGVLDLVEPSAERDGVLAGIAAGHVSVAVALPAGDEDDDDVPFVLETGAGTWQLTGTTPYVLDAPGSDRLLIPARSTGPSSWSRRIRPRPVSRSSTGRWWTRRAGWGP